MGAGEDPRATGHWALYEKLCREHDDLIESLKEEIEAYAEDHDEFTSTEAGKKILGGWSRRAEWNKLTGQQSRSVFGAALYSALNADWAIEEELVNGRTAKVYRRK